MNKVKSSNSGSAGPNLSKISEFHTHLINLHKPPQSKTPEMVPQKTGLESGLPSLAMRLVKTKALPFLKKTISTVSSKLSKSTTWQKICEQILESTEGSQIQEASELKNAVKSGNITEVIKLLQSLGKNSPEVKGKIRENIIQDKEFLSTLIQSEENEVKQLLQALDLDLQEQYRQFLGESLLKNFGNNGFEFTESERNELKQSEAQKDELASKLVELTKSKSGVDEKIRKCETESLSQQTTSTQENETLAKSLEDEIKQTEGKIARNEAEMSTEIAKVIKGKKGAQKNRFKIKRYGISVLEKNFYSNFQKLMEFEWNEKNVTQGLLEEIANARKESLNKAQKELDFYQNLYQKQKILDNQIEGLKKNITKLKKEFPAEKKLIEGLEKELKDLEKTKGEVHTTPEIERKIDDLLDEIKSSEGEVAKYEKAVDLVKKYSKEKSELENQIKELENQEEDVKKELRTIGENTSKQQKEIYLNLTKKKNQLKQIEEEIAQKKSALEKEKETINSYKRKGSELEEEISTKTRELEEAKRRYDMLSHKHAKLLMQKINKAKETFTKDDKIQELKQVLQSPSAAKAFVKGLPRSEGIGNVVRAIYEKLSVEEQKVLLEAIFFHLCDEEADVKKIAEHAATILVSLDVDNNSGRVKKDYSFLTTFASTCTKDSANTMESSKGGELIVAIQDLALKELSGKGV
ncbi:MAG: hypothetical protein LBC11_02215 [Puniceicoccales bacterium]|jgi:hypothetical protein|nr:hypothetical protein [Puniceicoccales bacterium]